MADRTIEFLLLGRDQASKAFDSAGNSAHSAGGKIGGMLKSIGTGALLGAGAALGAGVASVVTSAFAGAQEAAKVTRVLNSQIANLGPTGREAFGSAADFADQLSASIGKDDDDIKAVQTKLASFPDAFRQGSLGAEAMRRATTAAFDLQAIGIGDATSNIVGIGKALNDPIKGMTALSKAGVSFSVAQQTAIKQAMAQGDLAKAQSVILQGIESNAKGAAEAATSNIDKFKVQAANFAEGLAGQVLPLVERFAGYLLTALPAVVGVFDKISYAVQAVFDMFRNGTEGADDWINGLGLTPDSPAIKGIEAIRQAAMTMWPVLVKAFQTIAAAVGPVLSQIGAIITGQVIPALGAFLSAMAPIVAFLMSTLGPTVSKIFAGILTTIKGVLQMISGVLNVFAGLLTGDWSRMWTGVKQLASGAWTVIKGLFSTGLAAISGLFTAAIGTLKGIAGRIGDGIITAFKSVIGKAKGIGGDIVQGLIDGVRALGGRVSDAAASIVNKIPLKIRQLMGIASPSKVMRALGRNIMGSLGLGLEDEASGVESRISNLALTPSAGGGGGVLGMAGRGPTIINVYAGAVGSEDFLARTIREVQDRAEARGYGIGTGIRVGS